MTFDSIVAAVVFATAVGVFLAAASALALWLGGKAVDMGFLKEEPDYD